MTIPLPFNRLTRPLSTPNKKSPTRHRATKLIHKISGYSEYVFAQNSIHNYFFFFQSAIASLLNFT